jgi:hypothetical protein
MPGKRFQKSIKNKKVYHALRKKRGMSKKKAAKISNAMAKGRRKGGKKR